MRAVDTNVIVRYLVGDDPQQAEKTRRLIGHAPIFVPRTVLLEVEWVLRGVYELPASRIIRSLRALVGLPDVLIEDASLVAKAMD
jgi:predicted nucleic-acid-binding protein